jgi:hypothetical protein
MRIIYILMLICLIGYLFLTKESAENQRDRLIDELAVTQRNFDTEMTILPLKPTDAQCVEHWFVTRNFMEAKRRLCAKSLPTPPMHNIAVMRPMKQ